MESTINSWFDCLGALLTISSRTERSLLVPFHGDFMVKLGLLDPDLHDLSEFAETPFCGVTSKMLDQTMKIDGDFDSICNFHGVMVCLEESANIPKLF